MAIVALITWVITAAFGFVLLGTWIAKGGLRRTAGVTSTFTAPLVFGHFLLAAAGLVLWIVYLLLDKDILAWVAFAALVVVAGLGDVMLLRWVKVRRPATSSVGAASAAGAVAERHFPTWVVVAHGVFAVATVVLVLLTALGIGGS